MKYFKRAQNWVGSILDFGRKSVRYPYGTSGIRTIQLNSDSDTRFFRRPVSEIGEKKKLISDSGRPVRVLGCFRVAGLTYTQKNEGKIKIFLQLL